MTVINASSQHQSMILPVLELDWMDGQEVVDVLGEDGAIVADGHLKLNLAPHGFAMLRLAD
jgi:hypothetical protein